jgi:hypothetical protein
MVTIGRALLFLCTLFAASGCGSRPAVPNRLEPIPYADTLPSERPAATRTSELERLLDVSVSGEIGNALSIRRLLGAEHEALNVTRFDDVVNSAWFEHRNGRRHMSLEEVARGPTATGPDTSNTLTVIGGKTAGISPGFTVRDARGDTYLFKFDPKGNLQLASAAGVISSRLFWAAGYHTPEDVIVVFDAARLELDPDAEIETKSTERSMTTDDIYLVLDGTDKLPDGRYLALASKYVPGRPLGPFLFSGVRSDDPNDWYRHEFRRELRGLYVMSSWLNHVDMRFANTMDVFIDPPGYVRHYLIDFAATLGSGTIRSHKPREGTEYNFDAACSPSASWKWAGKSNSPKRFTPRSAGSQSRPSSPAAGRRTGPTRRSTSVRLVTDSGARSSSDRSATRRSLPPWRQAACRRKRRKR